MARDSFIHSLAWRVQSAGSGVGAPVADASRVQPSERLEQLHEHDARARLA
jgi:hypothetical protein